MAFSSYVRPMLILAVALCGRAAAQTGSPAVVISQVYGGGGNAGATLRQDFIEVFNAGDTPADLSGWTVQYAPATGSSWSATPLSGTLQPGQYYLVQEVQGAGGSASLPTPDATGAINLSATTGKVVLVADSRPLSGAAPSGAVIVDLLGYGDANYAETRTAGGLSNVTAAVRRQAGCLDTNNNEADFVVAAPEPRNSRAALNPCGPLVFEAGVTNAASYAAGALAPGEIVTIFGARLGPAALATLQLTEDRQFVTRSLGGTRVLFDGVAAPMIYAARDQVSAIAPFFSARSTVELQVERDGKLSNKVSLPVAPSAPGIFTSDASGAGTAAILNQDYSVNGPASPAVKGSTVMIFATGAGEFQPSPADGSIVSGEPPRARLLVRAWIGGLEANVMYAGAAPEMVAGVLQVNATIPAELAGGGPTPVLLVVGEAGSQPGVTVYVEGPPSEQQGSSPLIEQRLEQLKRERFPAPLPEIPNDHVAIPADWLALISWNTQVGGTSTDPGAPRPPMVRTALMNLLSGTYQLLAAQEIPGAESAELLRTLLPGGQAAWRASFFDTTDTMDNGFWYRDGLTLRDAFPLFVTSQRDTAGRLVTDPGRAVHPPQVAQFEIGDFDFTLISLHLTFADGNTAESARELRGILDYLDWYFTQPDHDPDVIVCGDFNTPSALSGQIGRNAIVLDALFDQDPRFRHGERRFVVTVHEPTSRTSAASGGLPASNYDHCVLSADILEEFIQARRVSTSILTDHPDDPEVRLTSDHFPAVAFFRTKGPGITLDQKRRIRP